MNQTAVEPPRFQRALILYRYAFEQDGGLVHHPDRAERVYTLLSARGHPHSVKTLIDCFYVAQYVGRFDTAEDLLFELIELGWSSVRVHGRRF